MTKNIGTLRGDEKSNIYCKSNLKSIERAYKKRLVEIDPSITRTKAVYTLNFSGSLSGAVFGYKKGQRKPYVANAFSHYTDNKTIIMICAHKSDYLIEDALDIMDGYGEMEVMGAPKIESVEFVELELA